MTMHAEVERNLYGYLAGELPAEDRAEIEAHLAGCPRCAAERDGLERSLAALPRASAPPSARVADAEWARFAAGVEARVREEQRGGGHALSAFWDDVRSYVAIRRAPAYAAAAVFAAVLAGVFLLGRLSRPAEGTAGNSLAVQPRTEEPARVVPAGERLERYLRRSKILLVGLTNSETEPGRSLDLKSEREVSRSLIKEARYLRTQDFDLRSARLIEDLNRILIELANLEDESDLPGVEIIRGGIRQENLLFKIRMAEILNDSVSRAHDQTF